MAEIEKLNTIDWKQDSQAKQLCIKYNIHPNVNNIGELKDQVSQFCEAPGAFQTFKRNATIQRSIKAYNKNVNAALEMKERQVEQDKAIAMANKLMKPPGNKRRGLLNNKLSNNLAMKLKYGLVRHQTVFSSQESKRSSKSSDDEITMFSQQTDSKLEKSPAVKESQKTPYQNSEAKLENVKDRMLK